MTHFHERLWPSPMMFIATALVIPASILVMFPISLLAGYIVAAVLYLGCVALLLLMAPTVSLNDGELRAGRARIPVTMLGEAEAFIGEEAAQKRGPELNARAYFLINGWVKQVVQVPVLDENDPAPYWLISTRRAKELAAAINRSRRPETLKPRG